MPAIERLGQIAFMVSTAPNPHHTGCELFPTRLETGTRSSWRELMTTNPRLWRSSAPIPRFLGIEAGHSPFNTACAVAFSNSASACQRKGVLPAINVLYHPEPWSFLASATTATRCGLPNQLSPAIWVRRHGRRTSFSESLPHITRARLSRIRLRQNRFPSRTWRGFCFRIST